MKVIFFTKNVSFKELSSKLSGGNGKCVSSKEEVSELLNDCSMCLLFIDYDFGEEAACISDFFVNSEKVHTIVVSENMDAADFVRLQKDNKADGFIRAPLNLKIVEGVIDDFNLSGQKRIASENNSQIEMVVGDISGMSHELTFINDVTPVEDTENKTTNELSVDDNLFDLETGLITIDVDAERRAGQYKEQEQAKIFVTDGNETFEIDEKDLGDAERDGFKRVEQ